MLAENILSLKILLYPLAVTELFEESRFASAVERGSSACRLVIKEESCFFIPLIEIGSGQKHSKIPSFLLL